MKRSVKLKEQKYEHEYCMVGNFVGTNFSKQAKVLVLEIFSVLIFAVGESGTHTLVYVGKWSGINCNSHSTRCYVYIATFQLFMMSAGTRGGATAFGESALNHQEL